MFNEDVMAMNSIFQKLTQGATVDQVAHYLTRTVRDAVYFLSHLTSIRDNPHVLELAGNIKAALPVIKRHPIAKTMETDLMQLDALTHDAP